MHVSPSLKLRRGSAIAWLLLAGAVAAPSTASAHAVLTAPKPRDNRDDHKDSNGGAPCGVARAASQPTNAAMAPGAMFNVTWNETVNHPGCFVIDFSASGDASWQVLSTVAHKSTGSMPRMYSQMVTLPAAPCTACTLRLRQIMLGSEPAAGACPPATVPKDATYYTCANVVLGSADGGVAVDAGGSGGNAGGTGGRAGGSGGSNGAGTGGTSAGSGGAPSSSGGASNPGSGGTAVSSGGTTSPGSGGAVVASGGTGNPGSGGAANLGTGGATNPGTGGGAAGGPGGNDDAPPPPCACGVVTRRSLGTGALLFAALLGMTLLRGRARRRSKPTPNQ